MKNCQDVAVRLGDAVQAVYGGFQQLRSEEFECIPNQCAIKMVLGEVKAVLEKGFDPFRSGLVLEKVAVAEKQVEGSQKIFGVKFVPEVCDEADIGLGHSREVQDSQSPFAVDVAEELFKSAAVA